MILQEMDWMIYLQIFHTGANERFKRSSKVFIRRSSDIVGWNERKREKREKEKKKKKRKKKEKNLSDMFWDFSRMYPSSIHKSNQVHKLYYHFSKIKRL